MRQMETTGYIVIRNDTMDTNNTGNFMKKAGSYTMFKIGK